MITIGDQTFHLHPSGVALWPRHRMAIVSDLHLEKGSHFARRGFFIPPYDTHATLDRLLRVCEAEQVERMLMLGDCFHDPQGYGRLDARARADFQSLLRYQPIWIRGNHDRNFVPPGFDAHTDYVCDGITFRHIAQPGAMYEISGHFHPKVKVVHKGAEISRPCFVTDGTRLIMPAFGSYTGGLFVDDPVMRTLFSGAISCHALGRDKVFLDINTKASKTSS